MRRTWLVGLAAVMILGGCAGIPETVSTRPTTPVCDENADVFLPPRQAPEISQQISLQALDCFTSSLDTGRQAELDFTLLGTEGERYQAILQALGDGTVNYFRESDRGWELHLRCSRFFLSAPLIPKVDGCDSVQLPGD